MRALYNALKQAQVDINTVITKVMITYNHAQKLYIIHYIIENFASLKVCREPTSMTCKKVHNLRCLFK
jgi:hypothetical protein